MTREETDILSALHDVGNPAIDIADRNRYSPAHMPKVLWSLAIANIANVGQELAHAGGD